jgi:hypothetical protein
MHRWPEVFSEAVIDIRGRRKLQQLELRMLLAFQMINSSAVAYSQPMLNTRLFTQLVQVRGLVVGIVL